MRKVTNPNFQKGTGFVQEKEMNFVVGNENTRKPPPQAFQNKGTALVNGNTQNS